MTSPDTVLNAYEVLFLDARRDVRAMEKDAGLVDLAQRGARAATDALGRAGVNQLPGAAALNRSQTGQAVADAGNRFTGRPFAPTRNTTNVAREAGQAQDRVFQQYSDYLGARNPQHARQADDFDRRLFEDMTPGQAQRMSQAAGNEQKILDQIGPEGMAGVKDPREREFLSKLTGRQYAPVEEAGAAVRGAEGPAPGSRRSGVSPWLAGGGILAAGGVAGGAGHLHGKRKAEEEARRTRNRAFGAGIATGVAAPQVYNHANQAVRSAFGGQQ